MRIAAKKLRYAAEFFVPLFPRKRARAYVKSLAALQDVLGRANDAATAARLVAELGGDAREPAAAALAGWVGAQGAAVLPLAAAAWARVRRGAALLDRLGWPPEAHCVRLPPEGG